MATKKKAGKTSTPIRIHRLTIRSVQRAAVHKTMAEYEPLHDTRFRCMVCGSVSSEGNQCCGEDMRKAMLSGK